MKFPKLALAAAFIAAALVFGGASFGHAANDADWSQSSGVNSGISVSHHGWGHGGCDPRGGWGHGGC